MRNLLFAAVALAGLLLAGPGRAEERTEPRLPVPGPPGWVKSPADLRRPHHPVGPRPSPAPWPKPFPGPLPHPVPDPSPYGPCYPGAR
jgi:hypothetical protein